MDVTGPLLACNQLPYVVFHHNSSVSAALVDARSRDHRLTEPPAFNILKPFHVRLLGLNSLKYCSSTREVDRSEICTLRPVDLSKTVFICMPEIGKLLSSRARLLYATGFEWG